MAAELKRKYGRPNEKYIKPTPKPTPPISVPNNIALIISKNINSIPHLWCKGKKISEKVHYKKVIAKCVDNTGAL